MDIRRPAPTVSGLAFVAPALLLLAACATPGAGRAVAADRPFTMVPGETVALPDASRLRYVEVAADSRCPVDVVCIRAGDADVVFGFTAAGNGEQRVTVNTDAKAPTPIGAWQLRLLALARGDAPTATLQVSAR
ncbi:hypothetical protein [Cognatilysobacter tabacisoli]|uniref:hypothetical protein n=1 Tax=Cognatilysobacter tabacisoli TaxID=2315424 RepID=UPI000E6B41BD|nr:hypothetical protein [Lysobacter tabacisoli]